MQAEVLAVGSELLLGQVVDTNSSYIGESLALAGIDCHYQVKVGDNLKRIVLALRQALARSDAVIVCGGLGPTQDDITREAISEVMNVELVRDPAIVEQIRAIFSERGREMAANNARQADVPAGASVIRQLIGTAPGLICPVGQKVVYAVPGVPYEMREMMERAVIPDLRRRGGATAVISSRTLRTWGLSESRLAEILAERVDALGEGSPGVPTIAFLASGIEGIKVRLTVKARGEAEAAEILGKEADAIAGLLGGHLFSLDDETMESAVGQLLTTRGWRLAVAESLTGGLVCSRIVATPGSSRWFAGGVVSYASEVKASLLGVSAAEVVSDEAAVEMATGVRELMGVEVGLSTTGVAGPDELEGKAPGTVFAGVATPAGASGSALKLPGDRDRVRQMSVISALNLLRLELLEPSADRSYQ